jgi:hypothetical protein
MTRYARSRACPEHKSGRDIWERAFEKTGVGWKRSAGRIIDLAVLARAGFENTVVFE